MWRPIRNLTLALLVALAATPAAAQTSASPRVQNMLAHLFAPPAQSITIPNTFVNGTVADATQVNANFTALSSNALNRNGGTMLGTLNSRALTPTSDATYALGTNVLRYTAGWFSATVTANLFSGSGASLTALDAAQLATNTVPTARLGSGSATSAAYLRGDSTWQGTASLLINGLRGCDIRLTLTSGTPITTSDVTGAATIYATPYVAPSGGPAYCAFYDGSATWTPLSIAEVSIALGTITSGLPYDVFCYNNSGAFACDAPVAWSSTTARATALAIQNGVPVKTGATTRRYIGTFFTTSTTQTEDSLLKRYVWNYYNRVPRKLQRFDSTGYNYTTATTRQANGSASNQVSVVIGVQEVLVELTVATIVSGAAATSQVQVGIGVDSTTTFSSSSQGGVIGPGTGGTTVTTPAVSTYRDYTAIGKHDLSWNENGGGGGTVTWNNNGATVMGLQGWIDG